MTWETIRLRKAAGRRGRKRKRLWRRALITMGIAISKVFAALFGSKEVRILILGLDNAGKTTILCT